VDFLLAKAAIIPLEELRDLGLIELRQDKGRAGYHYKVCEYVAVL